MRAFLMELFLNYGERAFPWRPSSTGKLFAEALYTGYIDSTNAYPSYKLTAKALEYIKTND